MVIYFFEADDVTVSFILQSCCISRRCYAQNVIRFKMDNVIYTEVGM